MASDASAFFDDDDEETLRYLLNDGELDDNQLSSRLESLARRFQDDHSPSKYSDVWEALVNGVTSRGLRVNESLSSAASSNSPAGSDATTIPSAFASPQGQQHLQAVASLLGVSERTAVRLTMSSLRNLNETTNLQSLLGTCTLVEQVMNYHYRQRIARLTSLTECLRKEQEDTDVARIIEKLLDTLDAMFQESGHDRGIFRYLISIGFQTESSATRTREQIAVCRDLQHDSSASNLSTSSSSSRDVAWNQFQERCVRAHENLIQQERLQALETLIVLCYNRIQGGIRRVDFTLLLLGFTSTQSFFRSAQLDRLPLLAGILCAECTALWRVLDDNDGKSLNWIGTHPLLIGLLPESENSEEETERELEALSALLFQCMEQVDKEVDQDSPESLALFSFSLLYRLAYDAILNSPEGDDQNGYWQTLGATSQRMFALAAEEHGALDTLRNAMDSLVKNPSNGNIDNGMYRLAYDSLLATGSESALTMNTAPTDGEETEMDAGSLVYASIGHELLTGLVVAYEGTILSVLDNAGCQNLAMVCDQASLIYRNSPMLCEPFWTAWEAATAPDTAHIASPLCRVMDSAFLMVTNAVRLDEQQGISKEQLLASVAPLIQLLATLCYNANKVEFAVTTLNPALLQRVLYYAALDPKDTKSDFHQNRLRFLKSFATLTHVGNSSNCRDIARSFLEEGSVVQMSGPSLLLNALTVLDSQCNELVLNVVADLLPGASVEWAWTFAEGFDRLGNSRAFKESSLVYPLSRVFHGLVACLSSVTFSNKISDAEVEKYLTLVWSGVVRLSPLLGASLSNVSREQTSLTTVASVLDFVSSFLQGLDSIVLLCESLTIQTVATNIRDALVEMLALNNLGESVMYYALLPISLSIGNSIENFAQERSILQSASIEESELKSKYGLWSSTIAGNASSPTKDSEARIAINKLIERSDIEYDMVAEIGGSPLEDIIATSKKALILLKFWSAACVPSNVNKSNERLSVEQRDHILLVSPRRLLTVAAAIPQQLRTKRTIKSYWDSVSPTNLQLLARFLDTSTASSWPFDFPALSLDIVHASIAQVRMVSRQENVMDNPLSNVLMRSSVLSQVVALCERAIRSTKGNEIVKDITLGILSFRILCCTTEAASPASTVRPAVDKLVSSVMVSIRSVAENVHRVRESQGGSLNEALLQDLQLASACLQFLSTQLEGKIDFKRIYEEEAATYTGLMKVILQQAQITPSVEGSAQLFSFLAAAVNFLRLSTEEANTGLLKMWQENSVQLICMPSNFMSIASEDLRGAISNFYTAVSVLPTSRLLLADPGFVFRCFPITSMGDSSIDVYSIARLISSLSDKCGEVDGKSISSVASSLRSFYSQLELLKNWRKCIDVLVRLAKDSQGALALQSDGNNQFLLGALETLTVLKSNAVSIEQCQTKAIVISQEDEEQIAESMAGLVLMLISESIHRSNTSNLDLLVESLGLISVCAAKLFKVLSVNANRCTRVENMLLASAIGILKMLEEGEMPRSSSEESAVSELLYTIGELLKICQAFPSCVYRKESIKTCLVLLAMLTNKFIDFNLSSESRTKVLLSATFIELRIMDLVVSLTSAVSVSKNEEENKDIGVFEALVDLVLVLSQTNDNGMLEILYKCGALAMIARNPLLDRSRNLWASNETVESPSFSMRGYIPEKDASRSHLASSDGNRFTNSGQDDPLHLLWRSTLSCFKSVLGASRQDPTLTVSGKERFSALAADFSVAHRHIMLACLSSLESSSFTKNALKEGEKTLDLLNEVCVQPCRDRQIFKLICEQFLPLAVSLVARFGSFLGASSGARSFFGEDDRESDDENIGYHHQSPFKRIYNAKHEAIRLSHFASRLCTAVTSRDFNDSILSTSTAEDTLRSESALEQRMSSTFAHDMENAAAKCFFSALSLLWVLHPANRSFKVLQNAEVGVLDILSLVKPGMVVGYVSDIQSSRTRRLGPSLVYVHYAEVLYSNAMEQKFYARDLETNESMLIASNEIVGLEDASTSKQFLLHFSHAPDSAAELEKSAMQASVGHLVLGLRWCVGSANPTSTEQKLVGVLTALLGAEMSAHTLAGSNKVAHKSEDQARLDLQFLEFYKENESGATSVSGRIKAMLGKDGWETIRNQLAVSLSRAEEAEKERQSIDTMQIEDGGFYMRSSGRNPFAQLAMEY